MNEVEVIDNMSIIDKVFKSLALNKLDTGFEEKVMDCLETEGINEDEIVAEHRMAIECLVSDVYENLSDIINQVEGCLNCESK